MEDQGLREKSSEETEVAQIESPEGMLGLFVSASSSRLDPC